MKVIAFLIIAITVLFAFCGCAQNEEDLGRIASVSFSRTNGSVWGRQLIISADESKISYLAYFPEEGGEFTVKENLPLSEEQWQRLCSASICAAESLEPLKPNHLKNLINKIFPSAVVDGTDNYSFTVEYEDTIIEYDWHNNEQTYNLVSVIESIANETE